MLGHQQNLQQQGNFRNEARLDNRFQQSQEPFARSEDAFRFGKLQQQSRNNLRQGDAKYTVFYFGIPTHVSPASVATHFPNASSHFPSSQLITAQVPIEREEAMRFDVLHARRAAIAPYENARHEAATFRRNDLIRRELMSQQRAELKRLEKAQMARERKSHSESVNNFGIPTHVSIAGIASHFPYASSHFPMAGQSKVPIAFEQTHRFDGLAARREALAAREAERMDDAAERREAILVHRQSRLQDKDRMRQEGVERAKARRAKLFADAMVAQRQMLSQQQQQQQLLPAPALVVAESDRNINQSRDITPSSLASEKSMPMEPIDNKSFFVSFALPETVVLADIERHFPRAAAAMHEFESEDCKKAQRDTRMPIPREAEEAHRFELVPVRRAAIISRDKKRMDAGQMRATDSTETRRFVAQNENLMRSRRVSNKDNAGWVEKIAVTTETVKDVKEHGTWSNVAKHDHTTVYVDQKISTHVDSKAFDADTNDRNTILQQHTHSTAAPMGLAPTTRPAAATHHQHDVAHMNQRENSETVVHATRDEAGKPLIDERDLAAAAQHNPHQSELTVISINNTSPAVNSAAAVNHDDNKSNDSNLPPVHNQGAPKETKVKPKKFCC